MVEIERLSDPVRLSALRAALTDAGIESFVFDTAAGSIFGGAAIRMRLMVDEDDERQARRVLKELGLDDPHAPPNPPLQD